MSGLIALAVAAGGMPIQASVASVSPATHSLEQDGFSWIEELELFLDLLRQILEHRPPPKFDDPGPVKLSHFNQGYVEAGLVNDLTAAEREYYSGVVEAFINHLQNDPGHLTEQLRTESITIQFSILQELQGFVPGSD